MSRRCIGILREVKNKWERRCPLSPTDVRGLTSQGIRVLVQPSQMRIFKDHEFIAAGAELSEDLTDAHTIFGVKEFPHTQLLPNKNYIIFSHVIKAQPYNMPFLDACLQKNVRLFDYETIRATKANGGQRLVFFGRFAGMAGMIDAFRGTGERLLSLGYSTPFMGISSSYSYPSLEAAKQAVTSMGQAITRDGLPPAMSPLRFAFTGTGNVSTGAQEIFNLLPHEWVSPYDLPHVPKDGNKVYGAIVTAEHMVQHTTSTSRNNRDIKFNKEHYYANPQEYRGIFHSEIAPYTNVLVNGMYWDPRYPRLLTIEQMAELERSYPDQKSRGLITVADISCDIGGSVEFLKKSTSIDRPFYMYDAVTDTMRDLIEGSGVLMLGVENLPAEFPREASNYFSGALKPFVTALAHSDCNKPWEHATHLPPELLNACITADGKLTPSYEYIQTLRASQEKRSPTSTFKLNKTDGDITNNVMLEGHLFDTGFINQALDIFEIHAKMFRVMHWDISPNRSERRSTVSRAVVQITAQTQTKMDQVLEMLKTLATAMPRAMARVSILETQSTKEGEHLRGITRDDEPIVFTATSSSLGTTASPSSTSSQTISAPSSTSAPTKHVLVLGSGYVAGPLIDYLSRYYGLTVASISLSEAQRLIHGYKHTQAVQLDVNDMAAVRSLISKHDIVVSLLPASMHLPVADACIELRRHMVTASYVSPGMRERDQLANKAGITIMNEVGLDPGLDHMSAMSIIHEVQQHGGTITSFESVCGGLPAPEAANNPLGYKFSWNPLGVLNASQNSATYKKDGQIVTIPGTDLLRSARPFTLNPAFNLEQLPNRDSLSYASLYGIPNVQSMYRGTLRYHGFSTILDGLAKLGLLNKQIVSVPKPATWSSLLSALLPQSSNTTLDTAMRTHLSQFHFTSDEISRIIDAVHWLGLTSKSPIPLLPHHASSTTPQPTQHAIIQSLCHLLEKRLVYTPEERDMVILDHKFGITWSNGQKEQKISTLISYGGDGKPRVGGGLGGGSGLYGYSAMARTVGLPTAITTHLLLQGSISRTGVLTPVTSDIYGPALKLLKDEGIECRESSIMLS